MNIRSCLNVDRVRKRNNLQTLLEVPLDQRITGKEWKWLETNELDEVEGLIKDAVVLLEKAVKSVVELRDITRARSYPEEEVLEEVKKSLRDIIDPGDIEKIWRNERKEPNTI